MDKLHYRFEEVCIFDFVLNCPFKLIANSFCISWFMFHARQNWKSQLSTFPSKSRYCGELWVHPTQMTCWLSPQNKHNLWLHDRSLANSEPVPLNRPVYFHQSESGYMHASSVGNWWFSDFAWCVLSTLKHEPAPKCCNTCSLYWYWKASYVMHVQTISIKKEKSWIPSET